MSGHRDLLSLGENIWNNSEKINSDVLALTYGVIVDEACSELQNGNEVNSKLDNIGFNIGSRLIEDFLARSEDIRCSDLKETAEVMAKVAFKIYLGIVPDISFNPEDKREFSIFIDKNPLSEYVELPENLQRTLWYSNVLCGIIRGALEKINIKVDTFFTSDALNGDSKTEIKVKLLGASNDYSIQDD